MNIIYYLNFIELKKNEYNEYDLAISFANWNPEAPDSNLGTNKKLNYFG